MWIEGLSNSAAAIENRKRENEIIGIKAFKEALLQYRKVSKSKRSSPPFSSITKTHRPIAVATKPSTKSVVSDDVSSHSSSDKLPRSNSSILLSQLNSCDLNKKGYYDALKSSFISFKNSIMSEEAFIEPQKSLVRYTIFGDTISCLQNQDLFLVSTQDVVKTILAQTRLFIQDSLNHSDTSRITSRIIMELRSIKCQDAKKEDSIAYIEDGNSDLLKIFYRINAIKTLKRQKLFNWKKVEWLKLEEIALHCIGKTTEIIKCIDMNTIKEENEKKMKQEEGGIDLISQAASQLEDD